MSAQRARAAGRAARLRPLALAALLAATVTFAACGGHGSYTHTVTAPGAATQPQTATAPKRTGKPLSTAQAKAFAATVNLRPADLPGFTVRPRASESETPAERRIQLHLLACIGARSETAHSNAPPEEGSPQFTHPSLLNQSVSSAVSFLESSAAGAAELALLRSGRSRRCLARYLSELFTGRHYGKAVVGHVSVAQGVPPAPGTTGGFAWRMRANVTLAGRTLPLYIDTLGFVYGPSEVRLLSSSLVVPFPAQAEEQLYQLLLRRATAHQL
jgi:hypothetical protein